MKVVTKMILTSTVLSLASTIMYAQEGPPPPMPPPPPGLPIDRPLMVLLVLGLIFGIYKLKKINGKLSAS